MSGDFVSELQYHIPEIITSKKCYMNMGPYLYGYRDTDI